MQAAADRGLSDVRFSAIENGERRPVNHDELRRILRTALHHAETSTDPNLTALERDAKATLSEWLDRDDG
jgi:hypothetical protein